MVELNSTELTRDISSAIKDIGIRLMTNRQFVRRRILMSRTSREETPVKIACIQMEHVIGRKERNIRRSLDYISEVASQGAKLIVLLEPCASLEVAK